MLFCVQLFDCKCITYFESPKTKIIFYITKKDFFVKLLLKLLFHKKKVFQGIKIIDFKTKKGILNFVLNQKRFFFYLLPMNID